jgi:hypothetical protein
VNPKEPLPLETYALALAHLVRRRREPAAAVLTSIDITVEAFSAAERHWNDELAEAFARRKGALAMKFSTAWALAQREVGFLDPAAGDAAATAWTPPAAGTAAKVETPSFLRPDQEPRVRQLDQTKRMDPPAILVAIERGRLPFAPSPAEPPGRSEPRATADHVDEGDLTQLPLETYASVCAALARGEPRPEALARYGLTAETFDRLGKAWSQRFQHEPQLVARFKELATGKPPAAR